jgi:hypothetical protein
MSRLLSSCSVVLLACAAAGCGEKPNGGTHPLAATLDYIRAHGFPRLSDLMPPLPAQLARIPGVETSATGLPALPDDLGGATFGNLNALVSEAQALAAQGFSESRRIEALAQNLAAPVHNLLGRSDLFRAVGDAAASATGTGSAAFLQEDGVTAGGGTAQNIFDQLLTSVEYAVDTGGKDGLPAYVVIGSDVDSQSIDISGLWSAGGDELSTGLHARVRLAGLDDMAVTFTLQPGVLTGLVPGWAEGSCADDVWQVAVSATPDGHRTLDVTTRECPGERDAVSTMSFAREGDGPWKLAGGFAQSFPGATGLRGFLGARQGFVVQAAAQSDMAKLAGAAAVLGESDFAAPSQEAVDSFGVGQLLARYFQESYFAEQRQAADDGDFNLAYWLCDAPLVSSAVKSAAAGVRSLCKGQRIDVESALGTFQAVSDELQDQPLVPSDVRKTVKRLVEVLTIRNTLFVGGDGGLAYKKAPDEAFAQLDEGRKGILPATLGATDWTAGAMALLPKRTRASLPTSPFAALTGGLGAYLRDECEALTGDAADKAGESVASAVEVCGAL